MALLQLPDGLLECICVQLEVADLTSLLLVCKPLSACIAALSTHWVNAGLTWAEALRAPAHVRMAWIKHILPPIPGASMTHLPLTARLIVAIDYNKKEGC